MDNNFKTGFEKVALDTKRRKYKEMNVNDLDYSNKDEVWSAKIDGAHAVIEFRKGKTPRIYGHRLSKKTNKPIDYTDKVTALSKKSPFNAVLRGEIFATKGRKVQPPETMTSILNSNVDKSLAFQKDNKLKTNIALFDIDEFNGDQKGIAPQDKLKLFKQILKSYPQLTLPDIAKTPTQKKRLLKKVSTGKHHQTSEGVVVYKNKDYIKAKLTQDHDVHIRKIFNEVSERDPMAGGFAYSWEPDGPIVGKVGTGFNFKIKKDMYDNPENYVGQVAKVKALSVSKDNVLQKPSYLGLHIDKNIEG